MVDNKVRGLQPWPLAWTHLAGVRLVLRRTVPLPPGARSAFAATVGARSAIAGADVTGTPASTNPDLAPDAATNPDLAPEPGTVVRAAGDELIVACGGGTALRILEIQPEGRRTMTAREFLAGRGVAEGARVGP